MTTSVELASRLFTTPDRLGWEYSEPLAPEAFADEEPAWEEPAAPDLQKLESEKATALQRAPGRAIRGAVVMLIASLGGALPVFVALCATSAWVGLPIWLPANKINQATQQHRSRRDDLRSSYETAHAEWQQQASSHERREHERVDTTTLWHPLHLWPQPGRVDVFGGTGHGWASLVATFGGSLLAGGHDVVLLDLSDEQVGSELAELAGDRGTRVTVVDLPRDTSGSGGGRVDLLGGLDAAGVAELLADAVHVVRRTPDETGLRSLDVELVHTVASRLSAPVPVTFDRIVAGLRALRRIYDIEGDGRLSADEVRALTAQVDMIGRTDRVHDELQFLTGTLDLLAQDVDPGAGAGAGGGAAGAGAADDRSEDGSPASGIDRLLDGKGLSVIATSGSQRRRKELLDGVVFHRVLVELRDRSAAAGGGRVLFVAGADRLGLDSLEDLTRQARRLGLRLVLLFEHLRGDLKDLVGGSGSTTVFMRLGNFQEADTAAQQIGRGQKLVLSQLTRQIGETLTSGTASTHGSQEGTSTTRSEGGGRSDEGILGSTHTNWSRSEGTHRSESWQTTMSTSNAQAKTDGVTLGRVHEFIVEPTQIQDLPHTAFVLVAAGGSGGSRRIVLGDCNPGISLLPRVADEPLQLPAS